MENKENFDSWRELLQDKMTSYQPEGAVPDWQNFEAKMSSGKGINQYFGSMTGKLIIAAAGLLAIVLPSIYFMQNNDNPSIENTRQSLVQSENQSTRYAVVEDNSTTTTNFSEEAKTTSNAEYSNGSGNITQPSAQNMTEDNKNTIDSKQEGNSANSHDIITKQTEDNPILPDAGFTYTLSGNCVPVTARCYPNVQSDSLFYVWTTSDGQSSNAANPKFRFEEAGNFTIQLAVSSRHSKNTAGMKQSQSFEAFPLPISDFVVEIENLNYHFKPVSLDAEKFKWRIAELTVENETEIDYSFVKSGTYPVQLIATSDKACISDTKKEIKVEVVHPIFIGNAFTPDGDGNNDYFGPKSESLKDFTYRFEVYNRNGGVIFVSTDPSLLWDGSMNGSDKAPEGFYIYKIYTEDKYGNSQVKTGDVLVMRRK